MRKVGEDMLQYLRWREAQWRGNARHLSDKLSVKEKKPTKIYVGDKRRHMISLVMDLLRDWRLSGFEHEASIRNGLRSALCLKGYSWSDSDHEAAALISAAFTFLGYKRPSWEEGQREYVVPRENCSWCGVAIEQHLDVGRKSMRFCSETCARAALTKREYQDKKTDSLTYKAAVETVLRLRNPTVSCAYCERPFNPIKGNGIYCSKSCSDLDSRRIPDRPCKHCGKMFRPKEERVEFCSRTCAGIAKRTVAEKACLNCGTVFRPTHNAGALFCSVACYNAVRKQREYECICVCCGSVFTGKTRSTRYCSDLCHSIVSRFRVGKNPPKQLTPKVFDYVFKQAA